MPELSPAQRSLDVTILHQIAFRLCLEMDEQAVREEKWIRYVREFEEGVEQVEGGTAQACFFLNPVELQQVQEIALEGRVLPQKSTDFCPQTAVRSDDLSDGKLRLGVVKGRRVWLTLLELSLGN